MSTVDLRAEAAAEVSRLTRARALWRRGDDRTLAQLEGDATWMLVARRTRVRRSLGPRVCLVWRVAFEDATGRTVESRIVPVLVEVDRAIVDQRGRRPALIRKLTQDAEALVRAHVEADCVEWQTAAVRVAVAFTSARQRREQDVVGQRPSSSETAQPGLFDRRAERSRAARAAAVADSGHTADERRRAIADAGSIARQPARLLLVLVP